MPNNVQFVISAEGAQAIQTMLKFAEAQAKAEGGFKRVAKSGNELNKVVGEFKGFAQAAVGGFIGIEAIKGMIEGYREHIREATAGNVTFSKSLTPLLGIGDNIHSIERVKDQVINLSTAWGVSTAESAEYMRQAQLLTQHLDQKQRTQITNTAPKLAGAFGGDRIQGLQVLTRTWENYGEELGSVSAATDNLAHLFQAIPMDQAADGLQTLMPKAKVAGVSLKELEAGWITLTKAGVPAEDSVNALARGMVKMAMAQKQGINLSGSFSEKLQQLETVADTDILQQFGARSGPSLALLVNHLKEMNAEFDKIQNVPSKQVDRILGTRMAEDPASVVAQGSAASEQHAKNLKETLASEGPEMRANIMAMDRKNRISAAAKELHPELSGIPVGNYLMTKAGEWGLNSLGNFSDIKYENELRGAGKNTLADYTELARGIPVFRNKDNIAAVNPGQWATKQADAERYLKQKGEAPLLTQQQFIEELRLERLGQKEAAQKIFEAAKELSEAAKAHKDAAETNKDAAEGQQNANNRKNRQANL